MIDHLSVRGLIWCSILRAALPRTCLDCYNLERHTERVLVLLAEALLCNRTYIPRNR